MDNFETFPHFQWNIKYITQIKSCQLSTCDSHKICDMRLTPVHQRYL